MSSNPSNPRGGVTSHQHNSVNPVDKSSPRECYDLDIVKDNPSFPEGRSGCEIKNLICR